METIQIAIQDNTRHISLKYSDHNTVTTTSESSEEMMVSPNPMKSKDKQKKKSRRSSGKKNKAANRDMLVGLIAHEMTASWKEDDAGLLPEDNFSGLSAADIFYAQMNCEELHSGTMSSSSETVDEVDADEGDAEIPDDTSFAGLALPSPVQGALPTEEANPAWDNFSVSRRSRKSIGNSSHSSKSSQSSGDSLSIDEIQEFVMAHMPEEVKSKIPTEAWGRIFGKACIDKTRKPANVPVVEPEEEEEKIEDDDSSVISDITEYTGFVDSNANTKRQSRQTRSAPKAPEEEKDSEEFCPILPPEFSSMSAFGPADSEVTSRPQTSLDGSSSLQRSKKTTKTTAGVNFGTVQVRYYERILDINPAVTNGAAVGIGWRYKRGGSISVDDWEIQRGVVRSANDLIMPRYIRESMLKELGYTQKDIATATRIILKTKNNRKVTVQNLPNQHMEEAVERAARKVKGILTFGKKKGLVSC